MTREQASGLYDTIRAYFQFYIPRETFIDVYLAEFKDLHPKVLKIAVLDFCRLYKDNNQSPTVNDIKSRLLCRKWSYEAKLEDNSLDDASRRRFKQAVDQIEKVLNGYGKELEAEQERIESENKRIRKEKGSPVIPPKTYEEIETEFIQLTNFLQLYDI